MANAADCERALFLHTLPETLPDGYSRLYFGAEFCAWAFPREEEVEGACRAARRAGWSFTLALPVLPESFLPRFRGIVRTLSPLLLPGDEVLISDLGALPLVRELAPKVPVVFGRVLSGQKRGPQILNLSLEPAQCDYFRQGSWYSAQSVAFLRERRIERVELDNLLQGIAPLPGGLRGTLHLPYAMVASSRNCPFRRAGSASCAASCGDVFTLSSPQSPVPLLQGGNTQFLRNDVVPDDLRSLGIDRLVWHPRLPR